jgi:small ligand-binding sensory domain FIST
VQIGPVGEHSFAHGYTASLALIAPATHSQQMALKGVL